MGCLPVIIWRIIFLVTNTLIALLGIVLIALGIYSLDIIGIKLTKLLQLNLNIVLLVLGIYILAIAVIGFVGFFKESPLMLLIFGGLVIVISIATFAIGLTAIYMNMTPAEYADQVASLYDNTDSDSKRSIDELQAKLRCCGPNGPERLKNIIPSCCDIEEKKCDQTNAYKDTCIDRVQVVLWYFLVGATWGSLITFCVSIFCTLCAFCIQLDIRRQQRREAARH